MSKLKAFVLVFAVSILLANCARYGYQVAGTYPLIEDQFITGSVGGEAYKGNKILPFSMYDYPIKRQDYYQPFFAESISPYYYLRSNGKNESLFEKILIGEGSDDKVPTYNYNLNDKIDQKYFFHSDSYNLPGPNYSIGHEHISSYTYHGERTLSGHLNYKISAPLGYSFINDISLYLKNEFIPKSLSSYKSYDSLIVNIGINNKNNFFSKVFPVINLSELIFEESLRRIDIEIQDYLSHAAITPSDLKINLLIYGLVPQDNINPFNDFSLPIIDHEYSNTQFKSYSNYLKTEFKTRVQNSMLMNPLKGDFSNISINYDKINNGFNHVINQSSNFATFIPWIQFLDFPWNNKVYVLKIQVSEKGYYFYEGQINITAGVSKITVLLLETGSKIRIQDGDLPKEIGSQLIIN